jgi:hypothetical protein
MDRKLILVIAAVLLSAVTLYVFFPLASSQPFSYDESDYMWAGRQGLWANYTDRDGLSFPAFISKGLELYRNPSKRASFSKFIRESGDIGAYRHYHGPMYAYWLATVSNAGVTREDIFRGSGLFIHVATAALILFGFWSVFPRLPRIGGLAACALFLFNRTALAAAMTITQHVLFAFWVIAALFAASMFFRRYENRWLYATVALLAAGTATVETTAILGGSLVIALVVDHRRARAKWPSVRRFAGAVARCAGVFLITLFIIWPKGVVEAAVLKGFLQQGYMALARKSFSPVSPLGLWRSLFVASPWELAVLLCGIIAAAMLWRRSQHSSEMLPWLAYVFTFLLATLKVTLQYTYYFAPLTAAAVVVTGVAFGTLWQRYGTPIRLGLSIAVVVSIAATAAEWARISKEIRNDYTYHGAVLGYVRGGAIEAGRSFYVPFYVVPTLHYYHPEVEAVGIDYGYPVSDIVAGLRSPSSARTMLCEEPMCDAIQQTGGDVIEGRTLLHPYGPTGRPLYILRARSAS